MTDKFILIQTEECVNWKRLDYIASSINYTNTERLAHSLHLKEAPTGLEPETD
jgi:hypothetical protein